MFKHNFINYINELKKNIFKYKFRNNENFANNNFLIKSYNYYIVRKNN